MTQGLLQWSPCHQSLSLSFTIPTTKHTQLPLSISATLEPATSTQQHLTARERRQLRNERRESKAGTNWKEQVEEKLLEKPTKKFANWKEELNINNLAREGPQWWIVKVSRLKGQETAQLIARLLARNYPHIDFKVYAPAIHERKKLKNGTYSVKPKPLFPGCVFIRCVLDKEIHDFIRECDGVGGFVGALVGNTKRQITRPRPVSEFDMEAIFRQAKEEQQKAEQAFEQDQQEAALNSGLNSDDAVKSTGDSKPKRRSRKTLEPLINGSSKGKNEKLIPGSSVRVVSGTFAEYVGSLKKLNRRTKKATVGFTLFGKESFVDLDVSEIVSETT
ncbi:Hypothetical predicted protein [Prunus dulcis]|uniref:NusG-like N-terminal domain-containing protein n=1 Tax=Prunus dulcis TaxID=3755 RepID=A0A5E4FBA7_PRUDU|nr:transcription termination/antitermination protein NusG [Prunus dulcis]XP_034222738.1 transcription termination/antitermination protein NusG [Prunus dulcis]XP_034222739.1 transcription termination/antitermination protein NusG [Prunus dulcis]VVA25404.1 Hypothetical predicted protein [Prunus dulcis]